MRDYSYRNLSTIEVKTAKYRQEIVDLKKDRPHTARNIERIEQS